MSSLVNDNLLKARCVLVHYQPFYGHMCMSMEWISSEMDWKPVEQRTMGVRILNDLKVQCLYYEPFVAKMTVAELVAIVQHEIEHLIRLHCLKELTRDPQLWNIACDMAVNGRRDTPKIGINDNTGKKIIPFKNDLVYCPPQLADHLSAPEYYEHVVKDSKLKMCTCSNAQCSGTDDKNGNQGNGSKPGDGKQQGKDGSGKPNGKGDGDGECPVHGKYGRMVDDHDMWGQSDANPDDARQVIHDMVKDSVEKSQGNVPGHVMQILKELAKPVVRWRTLLRQYLGRHVGSSRRTYSRANRRFDTFGLPGVSHHAAATVNVIIDTSGSVGDKELQQFFAEIDQISTRAKVMVLQWDHAFQGYARYRRGAWRNFKVCGRGGTDMAAPIYWLRDNNCVADCQIMLTDGYCNWADRQKFPMITCITTKEASEPNWGHVVRLDVNQ